LNVVLLAEKAGWGKEPENAKRDDSDSRDNVQYLRKPEYALRM
jgi:hypothetical protein